MKRCTLMVLCVVVSIIASAQAKKLVWSEEFDYSGLPDSTKWGYDIGGHGWGNNELQYYTQSRIENVQVKDGKLIIQARKEDYNGARYTSTRLISKNKGDWQYGRIDVRAKLPLGKGIWPAIWMLPTKWAYGGWPHSGDIDIMENVGYMPDSVFGTVHTGAFNHAIDTNKTGSIFLKDLSSAFHEYSIEWTKDKIQFLIDGRQYHAFDNNKTGSAAWPFDQAFHLLLNVAVGGNWGGKYGVDDAIFPQVMEVDYVRVYQ